MLHLYRERLERALAIFQHANGRKHASVAEALNNLGSALLNLGDPAKSKEHFQKALAIQEEIYGPDHPEVSTVPMQENNGHLCDVPINRSTS